MTRALRFVSCVALLLATASAGTTAIAQAPVAGFYGGVSLRDSGSEQGLAIGAAGNPDRFISSLAPAQSSRALVFGGYRWRNDLTLEAALASVDNYRLSGRGGVGLMLPEADSSARAWNVDVYGSWAFWRRFSLYGRLGYSQSETLPLYSTSVASAAADRRVRDGLNYGVGLRYDVNRSLGLKLEYARIGTYAPEAGSTMLPDGDQLQFGLQFRF